MRKSRFTESQIVEILREGWAGVPVAAILRTHGISRRGLLHVAGQVRRDHRRRIEADEGARGGERPAETALRRPGLGKRRDQGRAQPKTVTPAARRQMCGLTRLEEITTPRACEMFEAWLGEVAFPDLTPVRERVEAAAETRPRSGF
jgi:hypothetical protein